MWLARDKKNNDLYLYENEPYRNNDYSLFQLNDKGGYFTDVREEDITLPFEVTWENSPIEVEIIIKKKE